MKLILGLRIGRPLTTSATPFILEYILIIMHKVVGAIVLLILFQSFSTMTGFDDSSNLSQSEHISQSNHNTSEYFNNSMEASSNSSWLNLGIPNNIILPILSPQQPVSWDFEDGFDDQSNGAPSNWNCQNDALESNGFANFGSTQQSTNLHSCQMDFGSGTLLNNQGTFHFDVWMEEVTTATSRGVKIFGIYNGEPFQFIVSKNPNGTLYPHVPLHGTNTIIDCPFGTIDIPQPSATQDIHDWRIFVDHFTRQFSLVQDGILRCKLDFTAIAHPTDDAIDLAARGFSGDNTISHYDHVGYAPGFQSFHNVADYTSPIKTSKDAQGNQHDYSNLTIDWYFPGVGNHSDVEKGVEVELISAITGNMIYNYSENEIKLAKKDRDTSVFNLSSMDSSEEFRVKVKWLENPMVDWIGIDSIEVGIGAGIGVEVNPDLVIDEISFDQQKIRYSGENVTFAINYSNIGAKVTEGVEHGLYLDGLLIDTRFDLLENFTNSTWQISLANLGSGSHKVEVRLDHGNSLVEVDEENNQANISLLIHPQNSPTIFSGLEFEIGISQQLNLHFLPQVEQLDVMKLYADWGDGTIDEINAPTMLASHYFQDYGQYNLSFYADLEGGITSNNTTFVVHVVNEAPNAVLRYNGTNSTTGESVIFSCLDSNDWHADELICQWYVNGELYSSDSILIYSFSQSGEHLVKLVVSDQFLASDEILIGWQVNDSEYIGHILEITYEGKSYESDDYMEYKIHWRNETSDDVKNMAQLSNEYGFIGNQFIIDYNQYQSPGIYEKTISISYSNQAYPTETFNISFEINNIKPSFESSLAKTNFKEGEFLGFDVFKNNSFFQLDRAEATFSVVDNGIEIFNLTGLPSPDKLDNYFFAREAGQHILEITVTDKGGLSYTKTVEYLSINVLPTASISCEWLDEDSNQFICYANIVDSQIDLNSMSINWYLDGSQYGGNNISQIFEPSRKSHIFTVEVTEPDGGQVYSEMEYKFDSGKFNWTTDEKKVGDFMIYGTIGIIVLVLGLTAILIRRSDKEISNDLTKQEQVWEETGPDFTEDDQQSVFNFEELEQQN